MAAMTEPAFLRDIHRWAMQGNIDYITELNESIEKLSQHIDAVVKAHQNNDQAARSAAQRLQDKLAAGSSAQAV
jgi:hypothetical protein